MNSHAHTQTHCPLAITPPPPQVGIDQATGIVYNITGPEDMTLYEVGGGALVPWVTG
jgi:hypothetical protein